MNKMEKPTIHNEIVSFSPKSFYGAESIRKTAKRRSDSNDGVFKRSKGNFPSEFIPRILGPTVCWKVFYRQNDAFEYAQSLAEDVHVFSFESSIDPTKPGTGQRRYLASSLPVFWHYYNQLQPCQRHHYEIIPENAPCKLYFDLEYQIDLNPNSDGNTMVDTLIKFVCARLHQLYGVHCCRRDVLDLDASTPSKFSRHLIFQGSDLVFENNVTQGDFIQHIFGVLQDSTIQNSSTKVFKDSESIGYSVIKDNSFNAVITPEPPCAEYTESNFSPKITPRNNCQHKIIEMKEQDFLGGTFSHEELQSLMVKKKDGVETLFCDLGVYTKNRNFRLFQSSKLNKRNHLKVSNENQFSAKSSIPDNEKENKDRNIFFASLITNVSLSPETRLLQFDAASQSGRVTVPGIDRQRRTKINRDNGGFMCHEDKATLEGWGATSPYPEIDGFISSLVSGNDGCKGAIRHWNYWMARQTLVYDIVGYRWCHNVRRHHKSNNIMYVVDIGTGLYYQKCHDPDCQALNFRSPEVKLPDCILPGYLLDIDDCQEKSLTVPSESTTTQPTLSEGNELEQEEKEYSSEEDILLTAVEDIEMLQTVGELGL